MSSMIITSLLLDIKYPVLIFSPDIFCQATKPLSRIARIYEFHEWFFINSDKIRVIRSFVTFVMKKCPVVNMLI